MFSNHQQYFLGDKKMHEKKNTLNIKVTFKVLSKIASEYPYKIQLHLLSRSLIHPQNTLNLPSALANMEYEHLVF